MEIPDGAWEEDPDGIAFADVINRHLPNNIRIFSILPVNKRFDARMECISRKYVYLLPAEVIGIENDSSTEEVECHVKEFRAILQMFQGRHPFHNYTVRAQYRKSAPKAHVNISRPNSLIDNCSKLESQEDKGKHKIPTSDNISSMLKNENLDLQDVSDVEDPLMSLGENTEYGPNASDALKVSVQPRARWLHEPDEVDRISSAHFRKIHSCTCGGLETIASAQYIEIRMHGESFMVHQIRKMVGTAVAVKRALMPQDLITISLSRFSRVVLPIAPSEVLILSSCEFSFPKELHSHGTKFEYSRLTASTKILGRVNDFYSTVLLPEVVDFLDPSKPLWKVWLENLDKSSGIPDAEMKELRDSWTQWKNAVFVENRVDTENDDSEILQTRQ